MSEHQYIAFRAVDRPLTDIELRFAKRQSTRAEVTRWSFTNKYHYGDFHGEVKRLLQSGYDVHLHYSNLGDRRVALRLPNGISGNYANSSVIEPPVPLGLEDFAEVAGAILGFFGINPLMVMAAADGVPPLPRSHQQD